MAAGGNMSNFLKNKIIDFDLRGQTYSPAANTFVGLLTCSKGWRSNLNSTVVATNDTVALVANDGIIHLYKVTTGGTTASAQSTLYPGAANEAITDGTAVLTEQTSALQAGTLLVEPSGGSYARVSYTKSLANFAGTQGAGTTTASTGTSGTTSNNNTISFTTSTGAWGFVWGTGLWDASTSGNNEYWAPIAASLVGLNFVSGASPSFSAAQLSLNFSN